MSGKLRIADNADEQRLQAAKLLMEVQRHEDATYLLEQLLMEDDRSPEVWMVAGCAYATFEPETSVEYFIRAKEAAEKAKDFEAIKQVEYFEKLFSRNADELRERGDTDADMEA